MRIINSHTSSDFEKMRGDEVTMDDWESKQKLPGAKKNRVRIWGGNAQAIYTFYSNEDFSAAEWAFVQMSMYLRACELNGFTLVSHQTFSKEEIQNGKTAEFVLYNEARQDQINLNLYHTTWFTEKYEEKAVFEVTLTVTNFKE